MLRNTRSKLMCIILGFEHFSLQIRDIETNCLLIHLQTSCFTRLSRAAIT
jgi:hypothetical protein